MQTFFVQDENVANILKVVGNISAEQVATSVDDGVSQTVVAKTGIARVNEAKIPNPVKLRPFRTFSEIEQPQSNFILRIKKHEGLPLVALFDVHDNKWRIEAIKSIEQYLKKNITIDIPIFA
jgi:hypothetical protein